MTIALNAASLSQNTALTGLSEGTTVTAFSPVASSWIYAVMSANNNPGATVTPVLPTNTGTALSWSLVGTLTNASGGTVIVWRAFNSALQSSISVTVAATHSVTPTHSSLPGEVWLDVWTGAFATQTGAAVATSTSTTQTNNPSVTTQASGSQVCMLATDYGATVAPTSTDTIATGTKNGMTVARAYKTANSGAAGAVSVNIVTSAASSVSTFLVYEILASAPAAGPANHFLSMMGCGA